MNQTSYPTSGFTIGEKTHYYIFTLLDKIQECYISWMVISILKHYIKTDYILTVGLKGCFHLNNGIKNFL